MGIFMLSLDSSSLEADYVFLCCMQRLISLLCCPLPCMCTLFVMTLADVIPLQIGFVLTCHFQLEKIQHKNSFNSLIYYTCCYNACSACVPVLGYFVCYTLPDIEKPLDKSLPPSPGTLYMHDDAQ